MINSLTNRIELFNSTLWNKSWILQTWKEREVKTIESLMAPFNPNQRLNTQIQLHSLLSAPEIQPQT